MSRSTALRTLCLTALVICAAATPTSARRLTRGLEDFAVRTWNENDGLSASRITAIEQDRDGYLWLGTDAGLFRFDGVRFVPISEITGAAWPFGPVATILSAKDRSLWVSRMGEFNLARLRDGKLTLYGEKQGLRGGYVLALLQDHTGGLWAANATGLYTFDGERWAPAAGIPDTGAVLALHESRDGRLWVATRTAVFRRDGEGSPFVRVDTLEVASNIWQSFSEDADGAVYISDFRQGFRRVGDPPSLKAPRGWGVRLLHDQHGSLWVATRGQGLWRVRREENGTVATDVVTSADGLATDGVQCVFEDREGNIWVGTQAGVQRLTPHRVTPIDLPLARAAVTTPDGSVWIGSATGLTRFSAKGRRHYNEVDGLPGAVVLGLYPDPKGVLWVSTENGVARFENEKFSAVLLPVGKKLAATGAAIERVFSMATTASALWMRDVDLNLFKASLDGRTLLEPSEIPDFFRRRVLLVASDNRGNLWIGSADDQVGVLHPDGSFEKFAPEIGNIIAIHEAADGAIWVGGDEGLTVLDGGRMRTVRGQHGLPTRVKSILEDKDGILWIGFGSGIARIEKHEIDRALAEPNYRIHYRLFNTADGAAGVAVAEGSRTAVRADDGRLWFATSAGVTVVDPHAIGVPRPTASAVLEAVTADAEQIEATPGVMLPAQVSHVQFFFTALTLMDSMRVEFRYKLDGIDRDWVTAVNRQASYANLGPGPYTFRVIASNGDGLWSEPATLQFGVSPMFYQTPWFYALCAVGAFSLGYASWRLHARRVRTQFALVLAERIRMSRAIHDTLLQGLAGLALQLDDLSHGVETAPAATGERLRRIRRRVEEYIREARQSIWDLRSPVLERRSFPEALREVGSRAIADSAVSLDVSVKGLPQSCSPVVEQQLLLICQEALTNAVRHGSPNRVDVELEYREDQVRVRVSDDGRGFDPGVVETVGHYGVVSMRERAAQVRGRFTIASQPGKGTLVETVVPVN